MLFKPACPAAARRRPTFITSCALRKAIVILSAIYCHPERHLLSF